MLTHRPQTPQPGFGSITLLQKFTPHFKILDPRLKYDAQRSIFDEFRGVWIADETLSRVFDISSQSKQKLRSKRRSKIVKIYAN